MRARVPNHHPRTTFHTVSGETVRKVPEVPEMEPHETSQRHHSARSLPGMMARPTLGGLLEPLFGQFRKGYSRKFALIGFCELRLMRVLRSLLVVGVPSSIKITSST